MSSKVRARDGEFFYRVAGPGGDAPAMVHVHGFGISGSYLLPTAALLTDTFTTYVPDLPGYGRTPGPRKPLAIVELADSVVRFMDSVGLARASLVGNSMGCMVIARAAERHPDRVERVIAVSPAGGLHNRPIGRGLAQLARDGLFEPPSLLTVAGPDYLRFGLISALRLFSEMTKSPTITILQELDTPILLAIGSRDPLITSRERLTALAPVLEPRGNVSVVWLTGPAHAINFSHPEQLATLIRAYVTDPGLSDPALLPPDTDVLVRARSADRAAMTLSTMDGISPTTR